MAGALSQILSFAAFLDHPVVKENPPCISTVAQDLQPRNYSKLPSPCPPPPPASFLVVVLTFQLASNL